MPNSESSNHMIDCNEANCSHSKIKSEPLQLIR